MHGDDSGTTLLAETRLEAFFHRRLNRRAEQLHIAAGDATLHYLTCLLVDYARSDHLFDHTANGRQIRPLALLYEEALRSGSAYERRLWLQRLGDIALFVGGIFAGKLSRRFTDLEYCVAMGSGAYACLEQTGRNAAGDRAKAEIFRELSANFGGFVVLLSRVGGARAEEPEATMALLAAAPAGRLH